MPGVCPRCLREVYFAEEKRALGKVWHTFCFSCRNCRKLLDSCTVSTHCGELFCRNCCARLFTQSIKPSSPSTGSSDVLKNSGVTPAETNSISDSISDCCCCCTENAPDTLSGITKNSQLEEERLRGGGGEDEDVNCHLTSGTERCSESDCSNLGIISSVTLCNPSSSPAAVTTWYNRQHSASQSTFGYQPCARSYSARPSSTPTCGTISKFRNTDNSNKFIDKKSGSSSNPNKCLVLRRPGSPCRTVIQQLQQHQHLHQQQVKKHQRENQRNSHHHRSQVKQQCYQQHQHQRNKTSGCYSGSDSNRSSSPLRKSSYPPLPPSYDLLPKRRVSFCNDIPVDGYSDSLQPGQYSRMQNDNGLINGIASLPDNEQINPGGSSYTDNVVDLNQSENINENDDRLRGGCGGGSCGSGSSRVPLTGSGGCGSGGNDGGCGCSGRIGKSFSDNFSYIEGTCASARGGRRMTGYETCPPRDPEPCYHGGSSSCTAAGCSPPCGGRQGCCPPLGCRPLCIKPPRCNPPCTGDLQGCGGGGCCGGGCRGGCGKNGRLCMPLRSCSVPPCQPTAGRSYGSPCLPPRACPPQPPCCRSPRIMGTPSSMSGSSGGGSLCCRSKSPGRTSRGGGCCSPQDDNYCCQPRLPSGCECLGGGLDCQRCGRKVYQAEMQIASGTPYHNICFSCFCCRKPLESLTYQENCGEIYCKQCYVRNFGPQGYGYGAGAGVLQTPM